MELADTQEALVVMQTGLNSSPFFLPHKELEEFFSVKYFPLGIAYLGSCVCSIWQKP